MWNELHEITVETCYIGESVHLKKFWNLWFVESHLFKNQLAPLFRRCSPGLRTLHTGSLVQRHGVWGNCTVLFAHPHSYLFFLSWIPLIYFSALHFHDCCNYLYSWAHHFFPFLFHILQPMRALLYIQTHFQFQEPQLS